jgi:hypothetical protein
MRQKKQTLVGTIVSVNGNVISVKMHDRVKSTMPIIDVGTLRDTSHIFVTPLCIEKNVSDILAMHFDG